MNDKKLIVNLFLLILFAGINITSSAQDKPNVIFILADDLGYGDLPKYGHPYTKTPHLDKLADEGKRFTQGYMSGSWCMPARAALMTSLFPSREFLTTFVIDVEKPSVTSIMSDAGYKTAHIGKWHIGDNKRGENAPPPADYGIDLSFTTQSTGPGFTSKDKKKPHYREHTTTHYIDMAIDFAKSHKKDPFFINLWLYPTHSYIDPLPKYLDRFKDLEVNIDDFESEYQRDFLNFVSETHDINDAMRAYCADVSNLDDEIGRLLAAIEEMGLDDNTIIIFSSDNGPGPILNNMKKLRERYAKKPTLVNSVGSAGPFRQRKGSMYEGGIRAPWIIKWPKKIKGGTTDEETIFTGVDFLPTVAGLTGVEVPEMQLDGEDLSTSVLGTPQKRNKIQYWSDKPNWQVLRDGKWKAHLHLNKITLYDLEADLGETTDVASEHPELVSKYGKLLRAWKKEIHKKPIH
ncbi:sulfatase family protein [Flammeovirga agarivorans]|uniref:Sulfatase-like hydrolase/transferase n=1 Tax=Flammeovirga agarivorans TaxID=2726742 RepID=A0A7X8SQA8_9BACT|nr:sulfatase-like hydrolase/transferase [Flammeovirga agarivorans]NLR94375.1 sulfatase-like hydrolase/transferase [Flammeovirga agarivorans]